jgi:hypothetical protein
MIHRCRGGYCVRSEHTGRIVGTFPTRKKALAQERAIQASKYAKKHPSSKVAKVHRAIEKRR